jgi:hypothetical protein
MPWNGRLGRWSKRLSGSPFFMLEDEEGSDLLESGNARYGFSNRLNQ